jgi:hypothetical protein
VWVSGGEALPPLPVIAGRAPLRASGGSDAAAGRVTSTTHSAFICVHWLEGVGAPRTALLWLGAGRSPFEFQNFESPLRGIATNAYRVGLFIGGFATVLENMWLHAGATEMSIERPQGAARRSQVLAGAYTKAFTL